MNYLYNVFNRAWSYVTSFLGGKDDENQPSKKQKITDQRECDDDVDERDKLPLKFNHGFGHQSHINNTVDYEGDDELSANPVNDSAISSDDDDDTFSYDISFDGSKMEIEEDCINSIREVDDQQNNITNSLNEAREESRGMNDDSCSEASSKKRDRDEENTTSEINEHQETNQSNNDTLFGLNSMNKDQAMIEIIEISDDEDDEEEDKSITKETIQTPDNTPDQLPAIDSESMRDLITPNDNLRGLASMRFSYLIEAGHQHQTDTSAVVSPSFITPSRVPLTAISNENAPLRSTNTTRPHTIMIENVPPPTKLSEIRIRSKQIELFMKAIDEKVGDHDQAKNLANLIEKAIYKIYASPSGSGENRRMKMPEEKKEKYKDHCRKIKHNLKNANQSLKPFLRSEELRMKMINSPTMKIEELLIQQKQKQKQSKEQ